MTHRILIVDDDLDQCELFAAALRRLHYDATTTSSPREALDLVGRESFSAVLTDIHMEDMSGIELCTRILGIRPDVPVIVVTGQGSVDAAVSAIRAGAYDFLQKPVDPKLLDVSLARATQHHSLQVEVKRLRERVDVPVDPDSLLGAGAAMKEVRDLVARVGAIDVSVMIEGETGTGKELVARGLHAASARRTGPFVAINCAALPCDLLESELFGHVQGAFTDAKGGREGLFLKASGGTLFLDEIGEMPASMQARLLRALQERTVRPVGSNSELAFDARVITATHRDLYAEVGRGTFRQDLFYRINVVKISMPPLRERSSDILALATHFLAKFARRAGRGPMTLSTQAAAPLLKYQWPGNVRELENCMDRAVALARFDHVSVEDLPDAVRACRRDQALAHREDDTEIITLDELEHRYIVRAVKLLKGNKARAAQLLGCDRRTLYRRLEKENNAANGSDGLGKRGAIQ